MKKFLHEIRSEFPAFETAIIGEDLLKSYIVMANRDNERIKIQSGAFCLFGLGDKAKKSEREFFCKDIYINKNAKKQIIKDLRLFNIDSSKVYPGVERRAMMLARKQVSFTSTIDN